MKSANWTWGLSLIALTIAVRAIGIVFIALAFVEIRIWIGRRHMHLARVIPIVICLVGATGFSVAAMQGVQAGIRAAAHL